MRPAAGASGASSADLADAVLRCLEAGGWDERLGGQVPTLIGNVRKLDPLNPKLPALAALFQQVLKQHDQGVRQGLRMPPPKAG